jgi:DHA2 family multidrug resistance protein
LGWTATQAGLLLVPAALTTAVMMPIIGVLLQKGVRGEWLAALGMIMFFFFCFWGYRILTPDTSKAEFFWMLIFRGVALGLLFIPVTTLSLGGLKGRQIGEGAAFTGMMRQLGGSFGIALITTFMAQQQMVHRADLVSKLDVTNPALQNRLVATQHYFESQGKGPVDAMKLAYLSLEGSVTKQAMVLSYMDVFIYTGIVFLLAIPIIFLARRKKGVPGEKVDMSNAH